MRYVHIVLYVHDYLSNQRLMRHFSYTKLLCLTNTLTRFSARRLPEDGAGGLGF